MTRYLGGWCLYCRAVFKMLTKAHGAGASTWRNAHRMGMCYRWLADGQLRNGMPPKYMRML